MIQDKEKTLLLKVERLVRRWARNPDPKREGQIQIDLLDTLGALDAVRKETKGSRAPRPTRTLDRPDGIALIIPDHRHYTVVHLNRRQESKVVGREVPLGLARKIAQSPTFMGKEKRVGYAALELGRPGVFSVVVCVEGEPGYRPVVDYEPGNRDRMMGIAERLNSNAGVTTKEARSVVWASMPKP